MNSTVNLGLTLFESDDKFRISQETQSLNKNMKVLDEEIPKRAKTDIIANEFNPVNANGAGSYVVYEGELYILPVGHEANVTWENTSKTKIMLADEVARKYEKPVNGIPAADLATGVIPDVSGKANLSVIAPAFAEATVNVAGSLVTYTDGVIYLLPEGHEAGITWANTVKTATNIAAEVTHVKSDLQGKYTKPANGIPASDIAAGVIPYVTPEMYGAKGDGVTDDSAAISAMFNVNSPVYVMNGNYICDSEIRIQGKNNITITGTGTIYKHSTAENSRLFDFLECENIHVEGITFKSTNNQTPDSPGEHSVRTGALLSNVIAFTIDNSSFISFTKIKFVQIGYCFSFGTWNTTSSVEKYRTHDICMNDITMENCGMGIYCQNICDLSIVDWIFDDMAISPGGYHMFYGSTALKNINLVNLAFNGNEYSDDVILVESADQLTGANGDSNIIVENITAECSHFAATEPNTCMIVKNGIIAMHNHYSEDMVSGNSSILLAYYTENVAPNVIFDTCTIYHVDGTDKPLIAMNDINVNLQFINCDIRLNIGAYSVHYVSFFNCKMSGRRLVNTSLNTNFETNITFKECEVNAQGYSVLFNAKGKLILDNCRFKTNHTRVIHSTEQAGTIYAYNNIVDSSSGTCVFGLDSTYLTNYRDLNNTIYTSSQ